MQGWISAEYGRRQPAPVLVYSVVTRAPLRIMTLLWPTSDPHATAASVAPLFGEDTMPVGLVFEDIGAYSVAIRTNFNGFFPDSWAVVGN